MDVTKDDLFLYHPDPMWIYDLETLRFLDVNEAATAKYGYSRREFLTMTIADIRPQEDLPALTADLAMPNEGRSESGVWRHVVKTGEIIHANITSHTLTRDGRTAKLVAARDVSRLVEAEESARHAFEREQAARKASDGLARQFQSMFDAVPGMFLVFSPDSFDVVAASDDYLATLRLKRNEVVGQTLFHILPDLPEDGSYTQLRASCDRVVGSGATDNLEIFSVLVPLADPAQGQRIHRWIASNSPVAGPDGKLLYLMLRLQDVTDSRIPSDIDIGWNDQTSAPASLSFESVAHIAELQKDNLRLLKQSNQLKTTQRLLDTGTWSYAVNADYLEWSGNLYRMYGAKKQTFGHGFEDYVALVHPDDREEMLEDFRLFMESEQSIFSFGHRIILPDGEEVHLQGVAERIDTDQGVVLQGVVQNVTQSVETDRTHARARRMLEIAGRAARFGAWRYDIAAQRVYWSDETARIHDELPGFSPNAAEANEYYLPADRDRIDQKFIACLENGTPFNDVFEIMSAKGRRLWVRTTGEPEHDENGAIIGLQGAFQDITELMTEKRSATQSKRLLEIAGRAAKLGGWSVSLDDQRVSWSDEIAVIHELPPGIRPTYESGISYFAPEDQDGARQAFEACATKGIPFDDLRYLVTAKNNRIRVRSLGVPVKDSNGKIIAVQGAMQDITELANAQREADELSMRLADTLENLGEAFFTCDRERRFTYLNSWAENLLGKDRGELVNRYRFDDFPAVFGSMRDNKLVTALETGQTVRLDHRCDQIGKIFNISAHPTATGLAVFVKDVTEARHRDEQLLLLGAAVGHINDVVIITEADTVEKALQSKIIYVNEAFTNLTGFSCQEIIGQSPRVLQGPKTQKAELRRINEALSAFQSVTAELINYTKDGTEYWVELAIMPITDSDGCCTHFVSIQKDITARRHAEETLRFSDERFRLLSKSTKTAIWDWDIKQERLWWSDEMADIFGHRPAPEGSIPTVWRSHVHTDDLDRILDAMHRLLSGETDAISERYRFRKADGTWTTVEDRGFAIRDETGKAIRALGSMMDVSEKIRMEERLFHSQKMDAVGQLTGGVAHDFNNLLTVIMGNSEMLQDRLDKEHPLRRYADLTAMAAERAAELTSRLLAFSRKQALQPQVLDVNVVIAGLEGMMRRTLGENIDIEIVRAGGLWKTEIDLGQLETALLNLVTNARDAMPDGGALTIETANTYLDDDYVAMEDGLTVGQYVVISVSDTGHGIGKGLVDRVFEPFFTTKAIGKGTGLGLSMVYGYVKQTGGHIRVYSETDEGTTFKLYFPRSYAKEASLQPEKANQRLRGGAETILVVEDDSLIKEQLTAQLRGLGYTVFSSTEGQSALAKLRDHPEIDLLLTDVVLPGGMNGRQIADAARAERPDLKVLYTSGYSENAIVHHGRVDPGVDLLVKPYRRATLAAKVRKVFDD
ncbi:PAS domain-containing protein [Yoonia sp.]|uniref:PAS domain-containing protein n=1 Tax=Yoonia sp. TaxID=2212373 RepID=UPI002DF7F18D|nr:PAS domain-containing protein [Yoonia sp.]